MIGDSCEEKSSNGSIDMAGRREKYLILGTEDIPIYVDDRRPIPWTTAAISGSKISFQVSKSL